MGTITLTNPVAGNVVTAGLHATNYGTIQTVINGNLDANNWGPGKIFAPSKLLQETAVDGDGLAWDNGTGTWKRTTDKALRIAALAGYPADNTLFLRGDATWALPPALLSYRKASEKDIVNTAVETDLLNDEITIAANVLGTNKRARAVLVGDFLGNGTGVVTVRVKFGGTTLWDDATSITQSATRRVWRFEIDISNLGATNSQFMVGSLHWSGPSTAGATTGLGPLDTTLSEASSNAWHIALIGSNGTHAIDTTLAQTFKVTVQWGVASVNNSFRLKHGLIEIA